MRSRIKITICCLLINLASFLALLIVITGHAETSGLHGDVTVQSLLIGVGVANLIATTILTMFLQRRRPGGLDQIVQAVARISAGDFSHRLPEARGRGELAPLRKAFNGMADRLEQKIRELKASEEKYSTLVENASDGIAIIEEQKYVFANRAFLKTMGYTKEELAGMDYLKIVAPESVESLRERHTKRLQGLDVPTITEARFIDKSGEERYFEVNAGLIEHDDRKAVLVIFRDITDNKEYERSLKRLSEQMLRTQEEERRRISRELHDEIGQALSAMNISIDILLRDGGWRGETTARRLRDMKKLIEKGIDDVHRISYNLRPYLLDNFGIVAALRWYADAFAERTGIEVGLQIEGEWQKLDPVVETTVYRVIQEALTNISKYAEARRAFISLSEAPTGMELIIEDDGKGFATEPVQRKGGLVKGGLGLFGIGERVSAVGGNFSITSKAGAGTKLIIGIPVGSHSPEESGGL